MSVIKNSPKIKNGNDLRSVYIATIKGDFKEFEYIRSGKKTIGAYFHVPGFKHLSLASIGRVNKSKNNFLDEAEDKYEIIDDILKRYQFSPKNIFRFWNFLSDISENYKPFNQARDAFYAKHNITKYPAATGIEVGLPDNQRINLGLEAIKFKNNTPPFKVIKSQMQCEAWKYGPKFSRAALVSYPRDKTKKLYITGTSTVNRQGKTILEDKDKENISYVMKCVAHLLEKNNMSFGNIIMSIVYFKNEKMRSSFEEIYKKRKWDFPYNPVFSNICRNNFTFEIECIASNKSKKINSFPVKPPYIQ